MFFAKGLRSIHIYFKPLYHDKNTAWINYEIINTSSPEKKWSIILSAKFKISAIKICGSASSILPTSKQEVQSLLAGIRRITWLIAWTLWFYEAVLFFILFMCDNHLISGILPPFIWNVCVMLFLLNSVLLWDQILWIICVLFTIVVLNYAIYLWFQRVIILKIYHVVWRRTVYLFMTCY